MSDLNTSENHEGTAERKSRRQVMELRDVTIGHQPDVSLCLHNESMIIHRGDLVLVRTKESQSTRRFASMLQGLVPPNTGSVLFNGRDWATQHARTQFAMRRRIGRVFARQGWIGNLNVRDNLLLAKQHFGADLAAIEKELVFWADWFQIGNISRMRPALVEASSLQVHQWIRAYLGKPALLILERPMRSVSSKMFKVFLASVRQMQQHGAAVIWIAGSTLGDDLDSVSPDAVLDMRRVTEEPPMTLPEGSVGESSIGEGGVGEDSVGDRDGGGKK